MSALRCRWIQVVLVAVAVASLRVAQAQPYSTPVGCENCISDWYYVDHGGNTDYDCQASTYSDHDGTDYSLRRGNSAINDGNEVVAARAGVVTVASDGNFDQCTACGGAGCGFDTPGGGFSNYVVIDHGDPPPECPSGSFELWTCTEDGGDRRRCIDGVDSTEACVWGCIAGEQGTDDVCAPPPDEDDDGSRGDTDCDDTRADVHPGALEVCGDAVDQDCSGDDEECPPTTSSAETTVATSTTGGEATSSQPPATTSDMTAGTGGQTSASGIHGTTGADSVVTGSGSVAQGASSGGAAAISTQLTTDGAAADAETRVESGCGCRLGSSALQASRAGWFALLLAAGRRRRRAFLNR
ncbi:MAG TPA: MopE-related protein [Polyangiaceae bacterium]